MCSLNCRQRRLCNIPQSTAWLMSTLVSAIPSPDSNHVRCILQTCELKVVADARRAFMM